MPFFTFRQWVAGLSVAALFFFGVWYLWPAGPLASQLERRFDQMLEAIEKVGEESQFVQIGVARQVQDYFVSQALIDLGPPVGRIEGRSDVQRAVLAGRSRAETLALSAGNRQTEVSANEQEAFQDLTVQGTAVVGGERRTDAVRLRVHWVQEDGNWLIQKIYLLE